MILFHVIKQLMQNIRTLFGDTFGVIVVNSWWAFSKRGLNIIFLYMSYLTKVNKVTYTGIIY